MIDTETRFDELESKGFLVIPSFLSDQEVDALLDDFNHQGLADNQNCNMVLPSEGALDGISEKLEQVTSGVREHTDIEVDLAAFHAGVYFATALITIGWHQDHESYYAVQNHYDYLNFFIPIQKPKREKGNLDVIPWDALKEKYPEHYNKLYRGGAASFKVIGNKTLVTDDEGIVTILPFDIGELGYTPELDRGDLLLVRGDIIHKTQDAETKRIALSLRYTNPKTPISRQKLLSGGIRKTRMMARNWSEFGPFVKAFQNARKKTLTWNELQEAASAPENQKANPNKYSYLLKQKLASGSVLSSMRHASSGIYANIYEKLLRMRA